MYMADDVTLILGVISCVLFVCNYVLESFSEMFPVV